METAQIEPSLILPNTCIINLLSLNYVRLSSNCLILDYVFNTKVLELFDLQRQFCASNIAVAVGNVVLMTRQFFNLCLKEHIGLWPLFTKYSCFILLGIILQYN